MIPGLNWRNARPLDPDAFEIFEAGQFGACVCMSNMGPELALEVARRYPDVRIYGRLYIPGDWLPTPEETVALWRFYIRETSQVIRRYQVDNEPDERLASLSPEEYCDWWVRVVALLRTEFPGLEWGFPLPSVKGEQSVDYMRRCRSGIEAADWLADRGYWQELWQREDWNWGRRYMRTRILFPGLPIVLGEYGCSAGLDPAERARQYREYVESLPPYVESANAYIMAGADGWELFWIGADLARNMRPEPGIDESAPVDLALRPADSILVLQNGNEGGDMDEGYSIGPGMFQAMERNDDAPVEDEHYVGDRESFCAGEKGLYTYNAGSGKVAFAPFV